MKTIDLQLADAGWLVQSASGANVSAGPGVAVREFVLEKGHGRVDCLLFLSRQPAGVIEAKPEGTTLVEVEHQSGKYVAGLPEWMKPPLYPLPFIIYESTGTETRFTNGYDPDARSRRIFTFHRPETLNEWSRQIRSNAHVPTFRARLRTMPKLDAAGLWSVRATAVRNTEQSLREDRPRALIQMATGSGKTFTAANLCYRLIRHADANRILFLVDRSNLANQTNHSQPKAASSILSAFRPRHQVINVATSANTMASPETVVRQVVGKNGAYRPLRDARFGWVARSDEYPYSECTQCIRAGNPAPTRRAPDAATKALHILGAQLG